MCCMICMVERPNSKQAVVTGVYYLSPMYILAINIEYYRAYRRYYLVQALAYPQIVDSHGILLMVMLARCLRLSRQKTTHNNFTSCLLLDPNFRQQRSTISMLYQCVNYLCTHNVIGFEQKRLLGIREQVNTTVCALVSSRSDHACARGGISSL